MADIQTNARTLRRIIDEINNRTSIQRDSTGGFTIRFPSGNTISVEGRSSSVVTTSRYTDF